MLVIYDANLVTLQLKILTVLFFGGLRLILGLRMHPPNVKGFVMCQQLYMNEKQMTVK